MKLTARSAFSVALLVLLGTTTGCNQLRSRDKINKGVAAFKNAQYEQAVNDFQDAVKLDPTSDNAKMFLATSYAYQVVPNLLTPDNLALAQKALDGFNVVLAKDPTNVTALKQIATLYRNIQKFDKAKEYELKVIKLAPNDPEAYYIIGFIDWTTAHYKNTVPILAKDGLTDDGQGNRKMSKKACAEIKAANTDLVNEALANLHKAIELSPNDDDAMQYLQLTYRSKANLDCPNDKARKADLAMADMWIQKAIGARKQNELEKEKKAGGGITM